MINFKEQRTNPATSRLANATSVAYWEITNHKSQITKDKRQMINDKFKDFGLANAITITEFLSS